MENGSLMKVYSIAECSPFDLRKVIVGIENQILVFFFEWPLKTGFTEL